MSLDSIIRELVSQLWRVWKGWILGRRDWSARDLGIREVSAARSGVTGRFGCGNDPVVERA